MSVSLDKQVKSCHFERDSFFYNFPLTRFVKEMELRENILHVTLHDEKLCRRVETEADTQWSATKWRGLFAFWSFGGRQADKPGKSE